MLPELLHAQTNWAGDSDHVGCKANPFRPGLMLDQLIWIIVVGEGAPTCRFRTYQAIRVAAEITLRQLSVIDLLRPHLYRNYILRNNTEPAGGLMQRVADLLFAPLHT